MTGFLEYTTERGKSYALRVEQIRGLEGTAESTRVYASIAGSLLSFVVKRPYVEVKAEVDKAAAAESELSV